MSQDNTVNLNHLRVLREVIQAGSFTKASARLGLPKSRVSRTIAALERDLGVQLVYRTTRSFQLTDAGFALYRRIADPMEALADAISDVSTFSEEVVGRLRISVPEDMGAALMGELVHEFLADYPKVTIDLQLDNRQVDLIKDSVDLALRVGKLKDSSLTRYHVGTIRSALVMSPGLLERTGVVQSPADLEAVPFIAFTPSMRGKPDIPMTNGKTEVVIRPKARSATNNHFITRTLAVHGAGWAILPTFLASEEIKRGRLVQVLKDWTFSEVPLQFVAPKQREPAPRLERFVAFALQRLGPHFT
jgi:LysR family transcriptional regulator for bpeEF and oprC